jgi:NAD(P)-dependent dehydrogenase (short-subunit alcohol dehydrogenase family)
MPRALVTGSSSGIGEAVALRLLRDGWQVHGLDLAPSTIEHAQFTSSTVDLTDTAAAEAAATSACEAGAPDALVHAAGILRVGKLGTLQADDGMRMWQLHVQAATRLANIVVPKMQAARNGRVVLIGSRVARGIAGRSQYAATKAALISMARSWGAEVIADGVTVNIVSPAATRTGMLADPARQTTAPRLPPIGRLIEPDEVASMVAYLLSPAAAAITGQDIQICGGSSLAG